MSRRGVPVVLRQLALWALGNSTAGALIGLTVGLFRGEAIEAPTIAISVLFGNVVGFTAMISAVALFPRLRGLAPSLRALLVGLALLSGSVLGSIAVLDLYPLFVFREPRQAAAIVAINGILALVVGSVVTAYEAMRQRLQDSLREVEEVRLVEAGLREEAARAELAALQARINPHFFFNTLNTISSLLADDPERAEEIVQTLAELFRYTFKVAGQGPVALREELEFTRNYLTVEQARFDERLEVAWDVAAETLDFPVPGLVLQPLVENSVGHGLAPRAAGGRVTIVSRRAGAELRLEVLDDGVGLGQDGETLIQEGHGLGNVRSRLLSFYRGRASLELRSGPAGRGAVALLRMPREGGPVS